MLINKPQFWDKKKSLLAILLSPLALIVKTFIYFKKKYSSPIKFNIPVICVGNIYIGGTGKTPSTLFIAKALKNFGKRPVIIKKYYKEHLDEHELIKEHFSDLILNKSRSAAIKRAENDYDVVVLDDGFQDYKIKKNLNILCFNQEQLIGNGLVIPAGPLREDIQAIKDANMIIINGRKVPNFEKEILKIKNDLNIFYSSYIPENIETFKDKKLCAIAGIGNPENFFNLLERFSLKVEKKLAYPDHYKFSKSEILEIINEAHRNNYHVITTEKDYFRIKNFKLENINYIKLKYKIDNEKKFFDKVLELYDKEF